MSPPLSPAQAMDNVGSILAWPQVRVIAEQDGFWGAYREVADRLAPRGKLVPDVHLAVLLRQHGVGTIYTNDTDFLRFPFLSVADPFDPSQGPA